MIEIGIAMGAESMTVGGNLLKAPFSHDIVSRGGDAVDCMQPMGQTSENVASEYSITASPKIVSPLRARGAPYTPKRQAGSGMRLCP